jgi:hypothetical protein
MQQKRINLELNKERITRALKELSTSNPQNLKEIEKIIRRHQSIEKEVFSKSFLLTSFEKFKEELLFSKEEEARIYDVLRMKETRTISGVTPVTDLTKALPLLMDPPTTLYVNSDQAFATFLFKTLYEKHPPFLFLGSSHIGFIPCLIINNIQFSTRAEGNDSVTAIASSSVVNVEIGI